MKPAIILIIVIIIGIIAVMAHFANDEYQKQQKEIQIQEKWDECVKILLTFNVAGNLNPSVRENNYKILDQHEQCKIEHTNMQLDGWKRVDTPNHYESYKNSETESLREIQKTIDEYRIGMGN